MKRSEINLLIKQACDLFASLNFALPPGESICLEP